MFGISKTVHKIKKIPLSIYCSQITNNVCSFQIVFRVLKFVRRYKNVHFYRNCSYWKNCYFISKFVHKLKESRFNICSKHCSHLLKKSQNLFINSEKFPILYFFADSESVQLIKTCSWFSKNVPIFLKKNKNSKKFCSENLFTNFKNSFNKIIDKFIICSHLVKTCSWCQKKFGVRKCPHFFKIYSQIQKVFLF